MPQNLPETEKNKKVVRRYIEEVINEGNHDLIDTLFAPEMHRRVRGFLTSSENDPFPDGREEICDMIAEEDTVMIRMLFRATHQGTFLGIPATGKQIEITAYGTYRLKNGQIVWDTICFDWLDALEQMGAEIPTP
jgi:predicted ester cyclase